VIIDSMLRRKFDQQRAASPKADAAKFFSKIPAGKVTLDEIGARLPYVRPHLRPEDSFDVAMGVSGLLVFPHGEVIK
jgi:hypothetical protein